MTPLFLAASLVLAGLLPRAAQADPGHPSDGLRVETIRAERQGASVAMIFLLRNTGDRVSGVEAVFSDAGALNANVPLNLGPGDAVMLPVTLVPPDGLVDGLVDGQAGLFTVMFDFGDGSIAPVLVVLP